MVGLYHNPPENAAVLCVDEKTQIQALERTGPDQPLAPGRPATQTHHYLRAGTTSLFAALDIASGSVTAQHYRRHRHQGFLRFLKLIGSVVPAHLDLHLVLDNYDTHKTTEVRAWLAEHQRFHIHFPPTGSSWLNQVERWFGLIQTKLLARGHFPSTDQLKERINTWVAHYNTDPKPFIWTKTADTIIGTYPRTQNRFIKRTSDAGH